MASPSEKSLALTSSNKDDKDQQNISVVAPVSDDGPGHFAVWLYHAKLQRESEDAVIAGTQALGEDGQIISPSMDGDSASVVERMNARRSIRTATAFAVFFLVSSFKLFPLVIKYQMVNRHRSSPATSNLTQFCLDL